MGGHSVKTRTNSFGPTLLSLPFSIENELVTQETKKRTRHARFELSRLWGADHYLDEPPGSLDKTRWGRSGRRANSPLSLSLCPYHARHRPIYFSLASLSSLTFQRPPPPALPRPRLLDATPSPLDPAGCARAPPSPPPPMHLACVPLPTAALTDRVIRANVCDRGWRLDDAASPSKRPFGKEEGSVVA